MIRTILSTSLVALTISACSTFKPRVTDCVGRYFDYNGFRGELRYPVDAYTTDVQGDVVIAVGVSARGEIDRVDALSGDPRLLTGVRSALLWGSSATPLDSTVPNPFAGYQRITVRFLRSDTVSKPRSDREIIVHPISGHPDPKKDLGSPSDIAIAATLPLLDTARLGQSLHYPEEALRLGISGTTVITMYCGARGTVEDAYAEISDHPLFTEAALTAARSAKFIPAVGPDGKPMGIWITFPIRFDIDR